MSHIFMHDARVLPLLMAMRVRVATLLFCYLPRLDATLFITPAEIIYATIAATFICAACSIGRAATFISDFICYDGYLFRSCFLPPLICRCRCYFTRRRTPRQAGVRCLLCHHCRHLCCRRYAAEREVSGVYRCHACRSFYAMPPTSADALTPSVCFTRCYFACLRVCRRYGNMLLSGSVRAGARHDALFNLL